MNLFLLPSSLQWTAGSFLLVCAFVSESASAFQIQVPTSSPTLLQQQQPTSWRLSALSDGDTEMTMSGSCPFAKIQGMDTVKVGIFKKGNYRQRGGGLRRIIKLPLIGSKFHPRVPTTKLNKYYDFFPKMRRRFGDFYRYGNIALGEGVTGTNYVTTDPVAMEEVLQAESQLPHGALSNLHIGSQLLDSAGDYVVDDDQGMFDKGERWKPLGQLTRNLCGVSRTAEFTSIAANAAKQGSRRNDLLDGQHAWENIDRYVTDIWGAVFYGEEPNNTTAGLGRGAEQTTAERVVEMTGKTFEGTFEMTLKGRVVHFLDRIFPKNKGGTLVANSFQSAKQAHAEKRQSLEKRIARNDTLTDMEKNSILMRAINAIEKGKFTALDVDITCLTISVPLHTTRAYLFWVIIHLALNREVQEKVRRELHMNLKGGDEFTKEMLSLNNAPYLHSVLRETHRMTPVFAFPITKEVQTHDVTIHGTTVPQKSIVTLDAYSLGMDETILPDAKTFAPERWSPQATQARNGTPAEVVDSALYTRKYGAGKRMCAGAGLSEALLSLMVSQLVLDWDLQIDNADISSIEDISYRNTASVTPTELPVQFKSLQ